MSVDVDPKIYPKKFSGKSSIDAAKEARVISFEDDRRIVIDGGGIGLRSVKRFNSTEGSVVRTPGRILVSQDGYTSDIELLSIDISSSYYNLPATNSTYAVATYSDEYTAKLIDDQDLSTDLVFAYDTTSGMYSAPLTPDFTASADYTLEITGSGDIGITFVATLSKFLLDEHIYLASRSTDGVWTLAQRLSSYVADSPSGVSLYVGDANRVAFITGPKANAYDEYPFTVEVVNNSQQIVATIVSQQEEIDAIFYVGVGAEDNTQGTPVRHSYFTHIADIYMTGTYAVESGSIYSANFKRNDWSAQPPGVLTTFVASASLGIEMDVV